LIIGCRNLFLSMFITNEIVYKCLTMNQNRYYNLGVRKDPTGDDSPEAIIDRLVDLLKSKSYHYRTRWEHVQIEYTTHNRLVQIYFNNDRMIARAHRFASEFV
jgi:hypothetical protein